MAVRAEQTGKYTGEETLESPQIRNGLRIFSLYLRYIGSGKPLIKALFVNLEQTCAFMGLVPFCLSLFKLRVTMLLKHNI